MITLFSEFGTSRQPLSEELYNKKFKI